MSRDPYKLNVFHKADELVLDVYSATAKFPVDERFGLQSQLRRAALSVPTNIVEGCARRSQRDYANFLTTALSSASEVRYLATVAHRLRYISDAEVTALRRRYDEVVKMTQALVNVNTPAKRRVIRSALRR